MALLRKTLVVALLLAIATGASYAAAPTGFVFNSVTVAQREYKYTVYAPRDYDSRKKWPLVVFLHGAGECGTDGWKQVTVGLGGAIMMNMEKWPAIVIMAQKPDVRDAWEQHDEAVMAMVKAAQRTYKIDNSRIYLTGLSQGGHGTWAIGSMHPDVWAAIAPICGYGDPNVFAPGLKTMPIWAFHGEADTTVPMAQSTAIVDAIKAEGNTPKLTTYPGIGHNSWDKAYREENLFDWFMQNVKGKK